MEYKARHAQPFTVEQAVLLEPAVITSEIARLQNSLEHLRNTQRQLHENVNSEEHSDPILLQALEENKVVISSQQERISMLRLALELKGLASHSNTHYDSLRPFDLRPEEPYTSPVGASRYDDEPPVESDGVYL